MNFAAKVAGVVLASAALCGIGAGAALAATPAQPAAGPAALGKLLPAMSPSHDSTTQVGNPLYSRGFDVVNLSQRPMELYQYGVPEGDQGSLDSAPPMGSIVQPGQSQHFEETYWFAKATDIRAIYLQLNADGTPDFSKGEIYFDFLVDGGGGTSSSANTTGDTDDIATANDRTDTMLDPAGTTVNFTPAQQEAAAKTLEQLCQKTNLATCSFTPTSDDASGNIFSPEVRVISGNNHSATEDETLEVDNGQDFSTTDSWGISATVDTNIADIVNASVSANYQHSWTTTSSFLAKASHPVAPLTYGELDEQVPVERVTGDFLATMGNTTFTFNGITFDHPIPGGKGQYNYHWHSIAS